MFTFKYFEVINENTCSTVFMQQVKTKWVEIHDKSDVFRYKIHNVKERWTDNYLLQLNPNRGTNRRTPECINNIFQPFDETKFNFTKVSQKEVLFNICDEYNDDNIHSVLVNVSPITKYHSLICPFVNKKLPQVVTKHSLDVVFRVMKLAQDCELKIGFNSLCALASVNHLHYHLFVEKNRLPVENANWKHLKGNLYCLENYPASAFCFKVDLSNVSLYTNDIYKLIKYLLDNSIAHNVLIASKMLGTCEVYIWPRKSTSGAKQLSAFNVAVLELSGWFPVYNEEAFHILSAQAIEDEIKKWQINNFNEIVNELIKIY